MEKPSQLFCLRFADGALPVKYLGSNSFRAEYFPEVFLNQAARFHQMLECPLRTCLPNWIAPLLVLVQKLTLPQRKVIGALFLSELRKRIGTLRRGEAQNEPKIGPTEMRAEIIRLHRENLVPTLERLLEVIVKTRAEVSGENSRRTSGQ